MARQGVEIYLKENNMLKKYKPAFGARISEDQAQRYGERIEVLIGKNGGIVTPTIVVGDAKSAKSPLHDYFEWNEERAAEKYRLEQASTLLCTIMVVVGEDGKESKMRSFPHIVLSEGESSERGFSTLERVMGDEELRGQQVKKALGQIRTWRERYKQYNEFKPIVDAIDSLSLTELVPIVSFENQLELAVA